ncbi:hypothetical protein [Parapedobacter koreensis]|uniref:Outer membrane protein beta-barrel domain-containing protein n=1 Tax=Parapedobacter koreensis TaxID=332977 RepID=A0A1H7IFT5_9SPHI|nr:hypothetical protein [Parapedobacter koreensis]SEK61371.1 hypothetical protein SAMN05421740_102225 [Parapedobacter koreensis]
MLKQYLLISSLIAVIDATAQSNTDTTQRKVFVTSGMGWGFAMGETKDVLQAKFSNSLGLDISLANNRYFVYPSLDFLTFRYDQQVPDPDYPYNLEKGRSNFYILNLAGGMRKRFGKLNTHAYAGPGAGVVIQPRAMVSSSEDKVTIESASHITPTLRAGVGADYRIGGFFLFVEAGWLHNFRQIQQRSVNVISLYGGLKTDVTKLKDNVARVIGIE